MGQSDEYLGAIRDREVGCLSIDAQHIFIVRRRMQVACVFKNVERRNEKNVDSFALVLARMGHKIYLGRHERSWLEEVNVARW